MPIKLVAVDLDNTLLDPEWKVSSRARRTLQAVKKKGIEVVLATGRMFRSARRYAVEMELGDIPMITYNGALVRTAGSGRTLLHRPVPLPAARRVAEYTEERGYHLQIYVDDEFIVAAVTEKARYYSRLAGVEPVPVGRLSRFLQSDSAPREPSSQGAAGENPGGLSARIPTKMIIYEREEVIPGIRRELEALLGNQVYLTTSYPYFLEVMNREVSKGKALSHLAAILGITREEVMALGDSYNDLDMLEFAGFPVAMANAPAEVRARARFVTSSNREDGAAEALERFLLGGGGQPV